MSSCKVRISEEKYYTIIGILRAGYDFRKKV